MYCRLSNVRAVGNADHRIYPKVKILLPTLKSSVNDKKRKADEDTPLTAQISLLPYANEKVAAKVLEHAQDLKESDPKQSIELHEEVIRLLCRQIKQRNKKIRVLKKILLDALPEGEGAWWIVKELLRR